jgi:hypothetical protein
MVMERSGKLSGLGEGLPEGVNELGGWVARK